MMWWEISVPTPPEWTFSGCPCSGGVDVGVRGRSVEADTGDGPMDESGTERGLCVCACGVEDACSGWAPIQGYQREQLHLTWCKLLGWKLKIRGSIEPATLFMMVYRCGIDGLR